MPVRDRSDDDDPGALGAAWRSQMQESCESVSALVWKRVHRLFGIDLSDPRQATDVQVYRLLRPLGEIAADHITVAQLERHIDARVPKVFRLK